MNKVGKMFHSFETAIGKSDVYINKGNLKKAALYSRKAMYIYLRLFANAEPGMVTPTPRDKSEWSRMAVTAYAEGRNDVGTTYSIAAAAFNGQRFTIKYYDHLQAGYLTWLMFHQWPSEPKNLH